MIDRIEIWMHNQHVGSMGLTAEGLCAFEYTPEWLRSGYSISPFELPLQPGLKIASRHPFDGTFGVFADSLPDGWGMLVLRRYMQQKGVNVSNLSVLELLCLVGSNGRGALEYRPDRCLRNTQEYLSFEQLAAESDAILREDTYVGEHLEEIVQRGGSPGGARPKIFIQRDGKEWLVKFRAREDKKDVGIREYRYSLLAKECGIVMPETRLFDGQWFGVERFDRPQSGKVHVVSAAGLLRADYRIPCMDYRHLFALTMRLTHSMEEVWQLYRLMCFNVLIGNRDDHARNFSFIHTDGWHLSPAYDLLPCGIDGDYHTTSVCDNPLPTKADVLSLAKEQGLNLQKAETIWKEMYEHTRHP